MNAEAPPILTVANMRRASLRAAVCGGFLALVAPVVATVFGGAPLQALLLDCQELRLRDSDTAAHLVVQTTEALTHRFEQQGIHDLSREAFVEEVVTLLQGYLMAASA